MLWTGLEHQSYDMAGKIEEGVYYLYTVDCCCCWKEHNSSLANCGGGGHFLKWGLYYLNHHHHIRSLWKLILCYHVVHTMVLKMEIILLLNKELFLRGVQCKIAT